MARHLRLIAGMARTFLFLPPLPKPTGGLIVLHQIANLLHAGAFEVFLAPWTREFFHPPLSQAVPVVHRDALQLQPSDIWLVPEGWVNGLAPGLSAGARCVVYCQNWAYLFSGLPEGVRWQDMPLEFLGVSEPVAWYMEKALGKRPMILRPAVDPEVFHARGAKPEDRLRIAFMPRKNKAQASVIKDFFEARRRQTADATPVEWVPIDGLDHHGVADILRSAHLFLSVGFPEGCPLPPLEAMACGAVPVGYTGFGATDYAVGARPHEPWALKPWWPVRETPWPGNGFWTADADVPGTALALECAVQAAQTDDGFAQVQEAALQTAAAYSPAEQQKNVLAVWNELLPEK